MCDLTFYGEEQLRTRADRAEAELERLRAMTTGDPTSIYHDYERMRKECGRWERTARDAIALADQLQEQLRRAYRCCSRPAGVCFDPALIDGDA